MKEKILNIFEENVLRPGATGLRDFLLESDFFQAPASTTFHLHNEGGLAEHSLNVYNLLSEKNERYKLGYDEQTIAICGLLHDVCKVGYYERSDEDPSPAQIKFLKDLAGSKYKMYEIKGLTKAWASALIDWWRTKKCEGAEPEKGPGWKVNDQFPIGHGEKSVIIIQRFMQLTEEEALAIRWHMVSFDAGIHFNYPSGFPFREATEKIPLLSILFTADYEASNILEATNGTVH